MPVWHQTCSPTTRYFLEPIWHETHSPASDIKHVHQHLTSDIKHVHQLPVHIPNSMTSGVKHKYDLFPCLSDTKHVHQLHIIFLSPFDIKHVHHHLTSNMFTSYWPTSQIQSHLVWNIKISIFKPLWHQNCTPATGSHFKFNVTWSQRLQCNYYQLRIHSKYIFKANLLSMPQAVATVQTFSGHTSQAENAPPTKHMTPQGQQRRIKQVFLCTHPQSSN